MSHLTLNQQPKPQDWRAGSISGASFEILQENSFWLDSVSIHEHQDQPRSYFDSLSCVSFSALNAIEMMLKRKYGEDYNLSDRFTAIMSGTTEQGNTFLNVAKSIVKDGVIQEKALPYPHIGVQGDRWNKYHGKEHITYDLVEMGKAFLELYKPMYEWVDLSDRSKIKEHLKYSPIQIASPYARSETADENGIIPFRSGSNNHATLLIGIDDNCMYVQDHYKDPIKKLALDYQIHKWGMRYNINKVIEHMEKPHIENNTLVQLVEGQGGFGFYLDGKIIVDDLAKILATDRMRNKEGRTETLTQDQWDLFEKTNLKGE